MCSSIVGLEPFLQIIEKRKSSFRPTLQLITIKIKITQTNSFVEVGLGSNLLKLFGLHTLRNKLSVYTCIQCIT